MARCCCVTECGQQWATPQSAAAGTDGSSEGGSGSGGGSSLTLETGLLLGDERCGAVRWSFNGDIQAGGDSL